jgi:primosomal protein N' (replication factor Y)
MPTYVEVAVNVPQIRGVFHYHLPPHLVGQVDIGHLVTVPFGKQTVHGVVLRLPETPAVPDTRPVTNVVDPEPVLTPAQLDLARYLQDNTLAPLAACISVMLPPGLMQMADSVYTLHDPEISTKDLPRLSQTQQRLLTLLSRRGPLRGRQIERALPRQNWQSAANALIRRGLLTKHSVLPPPKVRPKKVRTAQLACHPQKAEAALPSLGRQGSQALLRRQKMLRFLMSEPGPVDVSWLYAESGGSLADLRVLAEKGLVLLRESEVWRDPLAEITFVPSEAPQLTQDQQAVWQKIKTGFEQATQGKAVKPLSPVPAKRRSTCMPSLRH